MDLDHDLHLQGEEKVHIGEDGFDKLFEKVMRIQNKAKSPGNLKKAIYIIGGFCAFFFVLLICISILKANFSAESILVTLLAFFTIFMSFVFYLKAVETSQKFYDTSYQFMKEVSILLGKMEERSECIYHREEYDTKKEEHKD